MRAGKTADRLSRHVKWFGLAMLIVICAGIGGCISNGMRWAVCVRLFCDRQFIDAHAMGAHVAIGCMMILSC